MPNSLMSILKMLILRSGLRLLYLVNPQDDKDAGVAQIIVCKIIEVKVI